MDRAVTEYLLGRLDDFPEGQGRAFKAGTRTVAVFRSNGKLYALANKCVHKGASLCEGALSDAGTVVRCPWHNWPFELSTGRHRHDSSERVRTYEVRLQGDQVILCA
jgi:NAD(P)H-dependent nitrite reductase small subunit